MNLQNILNELESVDGEIFDRLAHVSRRNMFSMWANKAAKVAVAAPVVMASALSNAYGQSGLPAGVVDVLNFALTLEYLEAEFYVRGTETPGLIPSRNMMIFRQIRKHEEAHVRLLRAVLGSQAVAKPTFDFTGKGIFPTVFSDFQTYAALAQAFEDTGVRAYKGQAGNLIAAPAILEVALNIHSVEARHAARVRALRGFKGWITNADSSGLPAAIYAGDNVTNQLGVELTSISGKSVEAVTESFDEPLTKEAVLAIAGQFIA
ncbi:ferritin-like domain-containing protein [Fibrella aquatica]|jgi:Ferritin-like domain|uniref:ferritin-like domain-containing protein n=1 Tax=Fibrella aquatica TaxID=3242487 RepID=UPI0035207DD0